MKPKVAFHGICKNEAEIARTCLESIRQHVDAWCVVDTGSTDGTQEIVRQTMAGVPGALHELPWKGFAGSRNDGLRLVREQIGDPRGWWLLTIDFDETLEVAAGFQWPDIDLDAHHVQVDLMGIRFTRTLLTKAETPWIYQGSLHEDIVLGRPYRCGHRLPGLLVRSTRKGARAKNENRYRDDVDLLRQDHEADPSDARTMFYIANSYRDAGDPTNAITWYEKCVATPGWDQQQWAAMHERARCMIMLGRDPKDVLEAHLLAYGCRPHRAETLRQLAEYLRRIDAGKVATLFDDAADRLPLPDDLLFVDTHAYAPEPRIGIITAPRPDGSFPLAQTLTGCVAADRRASLSAIRVFSDSTTPVRIPPMVAQEPADAATLARIAEGGIYGTLNYCRALEWAAEGDGVCVVVEDDVLFARDWLGRSAALLAEAERLAGGPVLLSLHHMFGDVTGVLVDAGVEVGDDRLHVPGPGAFPNGSQGVLCRRETAKVLAGVLRNRMGCETAEERKAWAMDCGLFRCCVELGLAKLFYAWPCMLWHLDSAPSTWASKDLRWLGNDGAHRILRRTQHFRPW